jgi:hypothetical protein
VVVVLAIEHSGGPLGDCLGPASDVLRVPAGAAVGVRFGRRAPLGGLSSEERLDVEGFTEGNAFRGDAELSHR